MDDAVLVNHKHKTMFYLKEGPWEKLILKRIANIAFVTEDLYKLCNALSDVSKTDLPVYVIWLASEMVKFSRGTEVSKLELVDGNSKRYKELSRTHIISYDRDMNSDAQADVTARLRKNTKK